MRVRGENVIVQWLLSRREDDNVYFAGLGVEDMDADASRRICLHGEV